ncbi:MAG: hypothetical protein ACOYOQ_04860 [Microthrixaceae bacterium]
MSPPRPILRPCERVTIATPAGRAAAGLHGWPDGTFGHVRSPAGTVVFAPDGPRTVRHVLRDGVPDTVVPGEPVVIQDLPPLVDHAAGGPCLRDASTGSVVLIYHGEVHRHGEPTEFWSYLGLAVSDDEGRTFRHAGAVAEPSVGLGRWLDGGHRSVDVGGGGCVVRDGELWVHHMDRSAEPGLNLAVMRAPLADVVAAGAAGPGPAWERLRGADGVALDLLPPSAWEHGIWWFDVARHAPSGGTLLVYSNLTHGRWSVRAAWSADGRGFDEPVEVLAPPAGSELLYVTLSSGDPAHQRELGDERVELYTVSSGTGGFGRWVDAVVERVSCELVVP